LPLLIRLRHYMPLHFDAIIFTLLSFSPFISADSH
jgi:hypothetical protein